uniref:Basigin n=1 Tax=Zosterops lateralis melanops TaxID=1220523 RepID=A0A8D2P088_ZOSLA
PAASLSPAFHAGFIKSPLSQKRLTQDSVELYCEAIGNPIPEIQWWFEGNDPNETYAQLWDGARQDRVKINATYNLHSTSTISIANLTGDDSGMYECRASNDPDRNHLSKSPKVKWIRSQANVFVIEREWPHRGLGTCSDTGVFESPAMLTPAPVSCGSRKLPPPSHPMQIYVISVVRCSCFCFLSPCLVAPQVTAYKKSEHGNEGDTGVLVYPCSSSSLQALENASGRYIIKSSGNKTELRILKLDIEQDTGDYYCNGTNSFGTGEATVNLRVRSRLAALWPFLGIVAEVLVLVTIIFIYEKRRKPDEVPDGAKGQIPPLIAGLGVTLEAVSQAGVLPSDTPGWKAGAVLKML